MLVVGIDDEVLVAVGGALLLVGASAWQLVRSPHPALHADSRTDADTVRDTLRRAGSLTGEGRAGREVGQDVECPVCYSAPPAYAVETSCGHIFCAGCILTWWDVHGGRLRVLSCPVCRQRISMFFASFSPAELTSSQAPGYIESLREYNRRFSGEPRSLLQHIRDTPILLRRLFQDLVSGRGLDLMFRVRNVLVLVLLVLYLLSPFDLVPEAVFGLLGVLDDLLFLVMLLAMLAHFYRAVAANMDQ